ncbi:hypothetical protein HPB50_009267 [Hyalomma asiaticum]|uniref:Uncharacterized protein n=1 Tax=Hyalomma asiaticum TaxID=266040 RepID=A0ACB7T8X1_HYAAI|nr:hypothetical protein HPB50_009267 [Hyalomma asiaticum]
MTSGDTEMCGLPVISMANLDSARGCFSGASVLYRFPCTADEDRTCQIATHFTTWNEILCYIGLEVRLTPETNGHFSLVNIDGGVPLFGSKIESQLELLKHQAATIIYWLLKTHHCLSTLSLVPELLNSQAEIVFNALLEGRFLKTLAVSSTDSAASKKLCAAISGLRWLEDLELTLEECPEDLPAALSELLSTTTSLSALRIPGLRMKGKYVKEFFSALKKNNTLRDLSLQGYALRDAACQLSFARYLHNTTTLASLTLEGCRRSAKGWLKNVLCGLRDNKSVLELTLREFVFDQRSAHHAAILLSENKTLRAFRVQDSRVRHEEAQSIYDCWLPPILKNETLEELHLSLFFWQPEDWEEFFVVLPHKQALTNVFVEIDLGYPELKRICVALRESGAEEQVTLTARHPPASLDLLEYMDYSEVYVAGASYKNAALLLNRLLCVDSISMVRISIHRGDLTLSLALADYVSRTTVLSSLYIQVHDLGSVAVDITSNWWAVILKALAVNESIRELGLLTSRNMDDRDLEGLADVMRLSRNISKLWIFGGASAFVHRMAIGIRDNYTLLGVTLSDRVYPEVAKDWFAVRDTANRNCDLVTRAALFADGYRDDRNHVAALERVSKHRALLEELADVLDMDEAEMEMEARKWLTCIEGLQDFMKYTGVVKERVEFHASPDGSAQLDSLNEDCWRILRRYLMLDDVVNPSELSVQYEKGPWYT